MSKSKPFEILYFETIPEAAFQESDLPPSGKSSRSQFLTWSFDAFGKPFHFSLEANTRLIAKIPRQKRQHIEKNLKFYRGKLEGIPGSWVRLTRVGQEWSGMIWDGQEAYIIDPLSVIAHALQTVPIQGSSGHAIYRLSDTRDLGNRTCGMGGQGGMPAHPMTSFRALMEELDDRVGVTAQGATRNIDMTVVTDPLFNNANSNPDAAVIARMNVVDGIFSEQLSVQISLVDVLPLQSNGGLTSSNASTLLNQFSEFASSSSFNNPGLAHLFTGRNLDGSTVGVAFLRSLCSKRFGTGVDQITGTGTAGALTVAHELGHNFGAPHDNQNGSPCASTPGTFLMNPFLNGSDQFSPCSLSQIQPVVNSASCLTFINIDQADLQPRFQTTPQDIPLGQPFSLVLSVTNNGQAPASNTRAEISIPMGLSLNNIRANFGSCTGIGTNQGTCTANQISAGSEQLITLTLNGASVGSFSLRGTVSADNDLNSSNNSTLGTISIASQVPPPPKPGTAWTAAAQSPGGSWKNSGFDNRTFRILLKGSAISTSATDVQVHFRGRTSGSYRVENVSLVQRTGSTLNGQNTTARAVTFSGTSSASVPTGGLTSDPIPFNLVAGQDVFLTFWAPSGKAGVYRTGGSGPTTWFITGTDQSAVIDWGSLTINGTRPYVYGAELLTKTQ